MHISKRIRPTLAIAAVAAAIFSTPAMAADEYYRWVGDDGVTHYGSRPPEGVEAEKISTYGGKKSSPAKSSTYSTQSDDNNQPQGGPQTEAQKQAMAARKEQCDQERERLSKLQSSGTRIRMQNSDGTSRYLSPEEINKEISSSQEFINQACK